MKCRRLPASRRSSTSAGTMPPSASRASSAHCQEQVRRAIEAFDMIRPGRPGAGGRLRRQGLPGAVGPAPRRRRGRRRALPGPRASGTTATSPGVTPRAFAAARQARLVEIDLPTQFGFDIPTGAAAARRAPCSACGLSKRHLFNQAALDGGYDVVATGHNLDDEAAVLFGNVLRWDLAYLGRQYPVLPESHGFARKVKPLVRLGEREMAAYCVLRGIDYIVEECPMAAGNRHLGYKDGAQRHRGHLAGLQGRLLLRVSGPGGRSGATGAEEERAGLHPCPGCGSPTVSELCAFCKLVQRAGGPARPAP